MGRESSSPEIGSVVTLPSALTLRRRRLPVSATMRLLSSTTMIPRWCIEKRRFLLTICISRRAAPGDRRYLSLGRDHADYVVVRVGDVDVAAATNAKPTGPLNCAFAAGPST